MTRQFIMLLVYLAFVGISALWSNAEDGVPIKRVVYLLCATISFTYLFSHHRTLFERVGFFAVGVCALVSAYWIVSFYIIEGNPWHQGFQSDSEDHYGTFYNTLLTSHVLGFIFVFYAAYIVLYVDGMKQRTLYLLMSVPVLTLLLLTGSRTPLVSVTGALLSIALYNLNRRSLVVLLLAGLVVAGGLFQFWDVISARGLSYRPEIWLGTLQLMPGKWLFGHGYAAPLLVWIDSLGRSFNDSHNVMLGVLYYFGFVGLMLFISLYARALWLVIKGTADNAMLLVVLAYGLLSGMTDGGGLLARPNEHWFNIWLPIMFFICVDYSNGCQQPPIGEGRAHAERS